MSKDIPNDQPELVTISGLQFKPYQMQCMELLAKADGYNNVKKWLVRIRWYDHESTANP
jgi:hypothetical protein